MMLRIVTIIGVMLFITGCSSPSQLNNTGNSLLSQDSERALIAYQNALVLAPDSPVIYYNAAIAMNQTERQRDAVSSNLRALDGNRTDLTLRERTLFNLGYTYFLMGDYRASVLAYRQLLTLNPDLTDARYNYELALMNDVPPTPDTQQQQTEPDLGQTDPEVTPTNQPNDLDGPTPTPERQDNPPDMTATPEGGAGDFADNVQSTPVPRSGGPVTIEEARQLFDDAAQEQRSLSEFLRALIGSGAPEENDW